MKYIFSQSSKNSLSDTSNGETLAFDMKTREIKMNGHRKYLGRDVITEILPVSVDDLFDNSFRRNRRGMFFSEIVFRLDPFVKIIRKLTDLDYSGRMNFGVDSTYTIEVTVPYYHDVIDGKASSRTLIKSDFVRLLIGNLNKAQYWIFCHQLQKWDIERAKDY